MSKVVHVQWFIGMGSSAIGIVITENDDGERKAYIDGVAGLSEKMDIESIKDLGGKVHPIQIKHIWEALNKTEGKTPEMFVLIGEVEGDYSDFYQRYREPLAISSTRGKLQGLWDKSEEVEVKDFPGARKIDGVVYIAHHINKIKDV